MSLSQIVLVWERVRLEWECFWLNLREDNEVSESKMAVCESKMAELKMAAITNLSQKEWEKFFVQMEGREVWVKFYFVQMVGTNLGKCEGVLRVKLKMVKSKMAQFKMADIIRLGENEWVRVRLY